MSAQSHRTESIDGLAVTTAQFAPRRAYRLVARLIQCLGPVLGGVIPALFEGDDIAASAAASLAAAARDPGAIASAFGAVNPDAVDGLICEVLAGSSVVIDGKALPLSNPAMIDVAFQGRLITMWRVIRFAFEVNFADFLAAAAQHVAPDAAAPAAQPAVASA